MTVTSGDCSGDRRAVPRMPAASVSSKPSGSSESTPHGKFWVLADEDLTSSSEEEDATTISASAFKYLCHSPSPDVGLDLVESASGLARRAKKRLERQRRQRSVAREFASSACKVRSVDSPSSLPAGAVSPVCRSHFPVLEPTTFPLLLMMLRGGRWCSGEVDSQTFRNSLAPIRITRRIKKLSYWALLRVLTELSLAFRLA
jgi:hypothetical protein